MDILFIFPPISIKERYGRNIGKIGGLQPPLGIASLASYVKSRGFSAGLIDAVAQNYAIADILSYIKNNNPAVVGISSLTATFNRAIYCAEMIKKEFPSILVIIGGHHATILTEEVMRNNLAFDICVMGEGELTLCELLEEYKKTDYNYNKFINDSDTLDRIKGIAFRKNNSIILTERRGLIDNISELPFPDRSYFNLSEYQPLPNQYKRLPLLHMVVSRGCPYNCSYCSANAVFGRRLRLRSPEKVIEEIEFLIEEYGAKDISFWDDAFTVDKKWILELCGLIINRKFNVTWTCYGRADTVDKEMLRAMKLSGCWNIFFGFESGVQEILNTIDKNIALDQIRQVNRWCKEVGIEVRASFMIALPEETPERAMKTIDFAIKLDTDYVQFCITTPFPGTKLFKDAKRYGKLDLDFDKYNVWQPVFVPFGYRNKKEVLDTERLAVRRFYFRPKYIMKKISKIRNISDFIRYINGFRAVIGFCLTK